MSRRSAHVNPTHRPPLHPRRYPWYCFLLGHAVAQLVEALRYKPEGRGFDSRWCLWNFIIDIILPVAL